MHKTISIIGAGNMGAAIIAGIHEKYTVYVCEKDQNRCRQLRQDYKVTIAGLETAIGKSHIILLAVKPQDFDQVLEEIRPFITKGHVVISIAAGITCAYIEKRLGGQIRVVRTMPNLPAKVGQGMTGICRGHKATNSDLGTASHIFDSIGKTVVVEEKYIDAITALSGSGPAYVFYFIECFINGAKSLGLKESLAKELIMQTLKGSFTLLEKSKEEAKSLRVKVTSKKGTTEAALKVLFKHKIDKVFKQALQAAAKRAKELSKS